MRMYADSFSHTGAHPIFYANRSDSFSDTTANNCRQLALSGTVRNAYTSPDATTYSSSHTKPYNRADSSSHIGARFEIFAAACIEPRTAVF